MGASDYTCRKARRTRTGSGWQAPSRNAGFHACEEKGCVFGSSPFRLRDGGCIDISAPPPSAPISMRLSELNMRQHLLKNTTKVPQHTASGIEDELEITNVRALMDLSLETKRAMEASRGTMNSFCYTVYTTITFATLKSSRMMMPVKN